jgi:hypothetical protein
VEQLVARSEVDLVAGRDQFGALLLGEATGEEGLAQFVGQAQAGQAYSVSR